LRLRVNQRETQQLAAGESLQEQVLFPNQQKLNYVLEPAQNSVAAASFEDGVIRVTAPLTDVRAWADGASIGLYFDLQTSGSPLKILVEKDLECTDSTEEERDPDAFPRTKRNNC
jgi:hypothetical protein